MDISKRDSMALQWVPLIRKISNRRFNFLKNGFHGGTEEDLFQSAILVLLKRIPNLRGDPSIPYFSAIINGAISDELRSEPHVGYRGKRAETCEVEEWMAVQEDPSRELVDRLAMGKLLQLAGLTEQQKFVLSELAQGKNQPEIAKAMNVTQSYISLVRSRAILRMRGAR